MWNIFLSIQLFSSSAVFCPLTICKQEASRCSWKWNKIWEIVMEIVFFATQKNERQKFINMRHIEPNKIVKFSIFCEVLKRVTRENFIRNIVVRCLSLLLRFWQPSQVSLSSTDILDWLQLGWQSAKVNKLWLQLMRKRLNKQSVELIEHYFYGVLTDKFRKCTFEYDCNELIKFRSVCGNQITGDCASVDGENK